MQASNFGGTFDQTFLWQTMPLYFFYTMVQKVKNDQKLKSKGSWLKYCDPVQRTSACTSQPSTLKPAPFFRSSIAQLAAAY